MLEHSHEDKNNLKIEVLLNDEDVRLNTNAIAELFNVDRTGITKHIRNTYKDNELDEKTTCAKIARVVNNGTQSYKTKYYNLAKIPQLIDLCGSF